MTKRNIEPHHCNCNRVAILERLPFNIYWILILPLLMVNDSNAINLYYEFEGEIQCDSTRGFHICIWELLFKKK